MNQVKAEVQAGLSNGTISCAFMNVVTASCITPEDIQACEDLLRMSFRLVQVLLCFSRTHCITDMYMIQKIGAQ